MSGSLFSYVDLDVWIPLRHPLRNIRQVVNDALASLEAEFEALCTDFGRPSVPPERLIRASLFQILFSVRSERQLMEQMDCNLLFRWFVGLGIDDPVWVSQRHHAAEVGDVFIRDYIALSSVAEGVGDPVHRRAAKWVIRLGAGGRRGLRCVLRAGDHRRLARCHAIPVTSAVQEQRRNRLRGRLRLRRGLSRNRLLHYRNPRPRFNFGFASGMMGSSEPQGRTLFERSGQTRRA